MEWRIQMPAKSCTAFVKRIIGIPGLPSLVQGLEVNLNFACPSWCPSFGIQSHRKTRLILVKGLDNSNACRVLHCISEGNGSFCPFVLIFFFGLKLSCVYFY